MTKNKTTNSKANKEFEEFNINDDDEMNTSLDAQSLELTKDTPLDDLSENYRPSGLLDIDERIIKHFKSQGYDLQWVRIYNPDGSLDGKHIRAKEADGYVFIEEKDLPKGVLQTQLSGYFGEELNKHEGLTVIGDLALAKIPTSRVKAKRQYHEQRTRERSRGIVNDIKNASLQGTYSTTRDNPGGKRNVSFGK